MRRRPKSTSYARRERDLPRMAWVKTLPCSVYVDPPHDRVTRCDGVIEADHMKSSGALSNKGPDDGCAPMCHGHHGERTNSYGTFSRELISRDEEREWRDRQVERTRSQYASGLVVGRVDAGLF